MNKSKIELLMNKERLSLIDIMLAGLVLIVVIFEVVR